MMDLDLMPEIDDGSGKMWRFVGIQSKNRAEWLLTQMALMHQKGTSVALYDTLGEEAMKFIAN